MKRAIPFVLVALFILVAACTDPQPGINGKDATIPVVLVPAGNVGMAIASGGGLVITTGSFGDIYTSADGQDWTLQTSNTPNELVAATWGENLFVAVGYGVIDTSGDGGNTWSADTTTNDAADFRGVDYGNGVFVVAGSDGAGSGIIYASPDGASWTDTTPVGAGGFTNVSFANGRFFAGTTGGELYTSADGTTWSGPNSAGDLYSSVKGVCYGNGIYLTADQNGDVARSVDGETWSPVTLAYANIVGLSFGSGRFAILDYSGSYGFVYVTTDGLSWLFPSPILPTPPSGYTAFRWVPSVGGGAFYVTMMAAM